MSDKSSPVEKITKIIIKFICEKLVNLKFKTYTISFEQNLNYLDCFFKRKLEFSSKASVTL